MRRDQVIEALRARPFRPFRVCVSDGTTYDVRHPETLLVMRHALVVGIVDSDDKRGGNGDAYPSMKRHATVDLLHVTQLEHLPSGSA